MKKNNNKGFTLIELLAVIVILLVISIVAVTSISAAIERNKEKQNKAKYTIIESVASAYYNEHKNSLAAITDDNPYLEIPLDNLDLGESELIDTDGNKFCGYVYIHINERTGAVTSKFIENVGGCNHDIKGKPYYGDVDLDKALSATDALRVLQYLDGTKELSNQQKLNADVNNDGKITNSDANCILKLTAGNATGGGNVPANCGD